MAFAVFLSVLFSLLFHFFSPQLLAQLLHYKTGFFSLLSRLFIEFPFMFNLISTECEPAQQTLFNTHHQYSITRGSVAQSHTDTQAMIKVWNFVKVIKSTNRMQDMTQQKNG